MEIMPDYRAQRLGKRLILAALDQARVSGFLPIELCQCTQTTRGLSRCTSGPVLLTKVFNGRSVLIDGRFIDTVNMALILDEQ